MRYFLCVFHLVLGFKELLTSIEGQDWTENVKEKGLLFYKWKQEHGNSTTKGLISHLASVVGASLSIKSDVLQEVFLFRERKKCSTFFHKNVNHFERERERERNALHSSCMHFHTDNKFC